MLKRLFEEHPGRFGFSVSRTCNRATEIRQHIQLTLTFTQTPREPHEEAKRTA